MPNLMNQYQLQGYIGKQPELRQGKMSYAFITIATEDVKKVDDKYEKTTDWHTVTMFGKAAENFCNIVNKGDMVLVQGRLKPQKMQNEEGVYIDKITLTCDNWVKIKSSKQDESYVKNQSKQQPSAKKKQIEEEEDDYEPEW